MTASTKTVEPSRQWLQRVAQLIFAAVLAAVVVGAIAIVAMFALARQYDGRVLPGTRAGGIDIASLSTDEARARLTSQLAYLADGKVAIKTPSGTTTLAYADAGRSADVDAMVGEAMAVGHSGDAYGDAVDLVRGLTRGYDVPLRVKADPAAIAKQVRQVSEATGLAPKDATVVSVDGEFKAVSSKPGTGLDEAAIGSAVLDTLRRTDLEAQTSVEASFVQIPPEISDDEAAAALAAANRMLVDVAVTNGSAKFTIPRGTVWRSILFGPTTDGGYAAQLDPSAITSAISALAPKVNRDPVNPTILTSNTGKPVGVTGGKNGATLNVDASSRAVVDLLTARGAGTSTAATVPLTVDSIAPKMSDSELSGVLNKFQKLGKGWTTHFVSGPSNGNGANIRIPARNINGTVIGPGEIFDFWDAVGPVDAAHGFKMGGVIKDGKSDFTGAMGGGICSASTTVFNAAWEAGLDLLERHNHYYYISRYPMGRDATVYQGGSTFSVRWRNDTKYPVLVLGRSTSTSVTIEIWGVPDGRKVVSPTPHPTDKVVGHTTYVQTTSLKPGQQHQIEVTANGFNIWVYRKVYDAAGTLIHNDKFYTHYGVMNGIVEVGAAVTPPATKPPATKPPAPTPGPTTSGG